MKVAHRIAALMLAVPLAAVASPALTGWTGGLAATAGSNQLYGWTFHVNNAVMVSALGVYDLDSDGLSQAHDVGVYRMSDHSLLASATVPSGSSGTLDAGFRYTGLSGMLNLAVDDYVIVMTMQAGSPDRQYIMANSVTTDPDITWINSAFGGGNSLGYPSMIGPYAKGMFGPNMELERSTQPQSVPEPTTGLLMAGGILAWLTARRRRA